MKTEVEEHRPTGPRVGLRAETRVRFGEIARRRFWGVVERPGSFGLWARAAVAAHVVGVILTLGMLAHDIGIGSPYEAMVGFGMKLGQSHGKGHAGVAASADHAFTPTQLYFMSPTGSDAANGLTPATAWASTNHSVNCGDVILAAAGSYTGSTSFGNFGSVGTCPSTTGGIDGTGGIYFATVVCAGASVGDCAIAPPSTGAAIVNITKSNWAVEGFKATGNTNSTRSYECNASATNTTQFHHIAFVNDISYLSNQGFDFSNDGGSAHNVPGNGCDYVAVVGSIAQNSAADLICLGAIDIVGPSPFDSNAGTHMYAYGNFSYAHVNVSCQSVSDTEAYLVDTLDAHGYLPLVVLANNISFMSDRYGVGLFYQHSNQGVCCSQVKVYNNTFYHDLQNTGGDYADGEINLGMSISGGPGGPSPWVVSIQNNIAQSVGATSGGGNTIYAMTTGGGYVWSSLTNSGNIIKAGRSSCTAGGTCNAGSDEIVFDGNSLGSNTYTDPLFTNTADLLANQIGVPNCSGFTNVTACMGWNAATSTLTTPSVISDLTPTAGGMTGKGYQRPSTVCGPNADYPTWLKGIVYLQASGFTSGATITEKADLVSKPCGL